MPSAAKGLRSRRSPITRTFHKKIASAKTRNKGVSAQKKSFRNTRDRKVDSIFYSVKHGSRQRCSPSWGGMNIPEKETPAMDQFQEQISETLDEMLSDHK